MAYPYSKAETLADGAVHFAGLALAVPAFFLLTQHAQQSTAGMWPTAVYAICALISFAASAVYHMSPVDRTRPALQRIDHAAIYFKIAGTYAPIVALIGTVYAFGIFVLVWVLALAGAVAKLWFWGAKGKASLWLYLAMGWLAALLIWPMWHALSGVALGLIVVGGLIYSAGARVYAHPGLAYQNAIWHLVVLIASSCLFSAIALSI